MWSKLPAQLEHKCYKCQKNAVNDVMGKKGIVFVRALEKGEWGSFPICKSCWKQEMGEAVPKYMFIEEK
jgi:hypothetical protein